MANHKKTVINSNTWEGFPQTSQSHRTLQDIVREPEALKNNVTMKYLTEYEKEDGMYGGHVFAETWKEAEALAKQKGETVVGYIPPDCSDCERELELRKTV